MKKLLFSTLFAISGMLAYQADAQYVQGFDDNGTAAPISGTWDTTSTCWASNTLVALTSTVAFTNGNFALFTASNTAASTISSLTITVPNAITCEGIGDGVTYNSPNGVQNGAYVTTLSFNGAGSINLPTGAWSFDCGAGANNMIFNIPITGPGEVVQHNNGSMSLFGNNTYSGGTSATGGEIIYYNNNNSFGTGTISTSGGGTSFWCTNGSANIVTLANPWSVASSTTTINFVNGDTILSGNMALSTTLVVLKNSSTFGTNLTISGAISGASAVDLQTPNSGTIILSGANTYTGQTDITNSGATATVSVSSINSVTTPAQQANSSLGKPSSAATGTIQLGYQGFAGQLIYTGSGETSDRAIALSGTTGGGTIEMDGTGPLILTSAFTAPGAGSKTLTLQGSSITANAINGAIVNNSSANKTSLTKIQAGTWNLGGLNTFSGNMTISAGTLDITGSGDLGNSGGSGTYAGTIANSATLVFNSSAAQTLGGVISGAGAFLQIGAGNLTLTATNTYTGTTTVGGTSTLIVSGTGKLAGTGPIVLNGNLNITSTVGMSLSGLLSGSGNFNLSASQAPTETLANINNTFTGLFNVTAGTLAIDGDGSLGAVPGSVVTNYITLNGGPGANLRANTNGLTINANRGITLGANGGCVQVAGNDTCTYNGIISGSGQFQVGVNATTGLGILVLGGQEAYTNNTILAAGTTRLATGASIGNSSGILMSNTPTLDVSAFAPFALSTTNTVTIIGATNTPTSPAIILGASGSTVDFGAQTVNLSYGPAWTNGDAAHPVLTVLQSSLTLNGNTINVTNAAGSTLDIGDYALITCTNGFNITSSLTVNYVGLLQPNTVAQLVVINNVLVMQVIPTGSYANSSTTNQSPYPGPSITYGTASVTVSGTIVGTNGTYPAQGETVTVSIPTVGTTTTTIADTTGDFTDMVTTTTAPAGTYPITLSYAGPTTAPSMDTSTALTISKAAVTVTASGQTKTYGQSITNGVAQTEFTAAGLQNSETIGSVTLTVSGTPPGSQTNATVGNSPYTITPSAATGGTFNANNYTITYVTGTLTVNPLPLGLVGTITYNGNAAALFSALTITNKAVSTDVVTLVSGSVTLAASAAGPETITDATGLTLGGGAAGNYTTTGAIGSVQVNPLPVGLTGMITYNGAASAPYSVLTITNIVGSDIVSLASGSVTLASKSAGSEAITSASGLTLSGAQAGNYTNTGAIGSVTVNPLPVGLMGTRFYDGTATAVYSILSITNIVGSDIVNLASGSVTLASPANGSEPIISASGLTLGGAQVGDYTIVGATGVVTVTANPSPTSIVFSSANNALTLSWPLDHTGWTLEAQTNDVSAGISANWAPVSGSTTTNQMTLPVDPDNGCVFYQLIYNP